MRNTAGVLIAIALFTPAARAANVDVERPHITYLAVSQTAVTCKAPFRRGCTTLQTEFFCSCVQNADKWMLAPHIIATPWIYIASREIMTHELLHISDLHHSLNEYTGTLMMHSFATESECNSFSDAEKRNFENTMRNIQRVTVLRRDGERYAERAGGR